MTMLKLQFAGTIKKVETRNAAGKTIAAVQICKKVAGRDVEPGTFTWIRVTVWEPKDWQRMVVGGFISGCGDFTSRSYEKTDGTKGTALEVRCSSFDIELPDDRAKGVPATVSEPKPVAPPPTTIANSVATDEPPF